jgi:cytochrome c-type biogenesis protein CcmH
MLIFWIIIALLILLALWFVLPPLFQSDETQPKEDVRAANVSVYRDQYRELEEDFRNGLIAEDQYQREKGELERRLLEDVSNVNNLSREKDSQPNRKMAFAVAVAIPLVAISFYVAVGNPQAISGLPTNGELSAPATQQGGTMSQQQIEQNVAKLSKRLDENPNDAQGWLMLGRSYMVLERFADAAAAFQRATSLNATDANAWADYAEAQALANGQRMAGKPLEAANRALQLDPKNEKALALAGSAAFETNDYQKAIDYWQKLLALLPPNSDAAKTVSDQLTKAKQLAAGRSSR